MLTSGLILHFIPPDLLNSGQIFLVSLLSAYFKFCNPGMGLWCWTRSLVPPPHHLDLEFHHPNLYPKDDPEVIYNFFSKYVFASVGLSCYIWSSIWYLVILSNISLPPIKPSMLSFFLTSYAFILHISVFFPSCQPSPVGIQWLYVHFYWPDLCYFQLSRPRKWNVYYMNVCSSFLPKVKERWKFKAQSHAFLSSNHL